MPSKIILFLSDLKDGAAEKEYTCPDKKKVLGTQTNDAPVRYLLRSGRGVSEVICVVTEQAKQTALERFEQLVHEAAPKAQIVAIPYEEYQDFRQAAIPAILDQVKRKDNIYLDVTGGFRNANMHLLLLSRVLSYKGIRTAGAVYSNFKTSTVEDVSHLFRLFDLVGGMQELTSLGSVQTLRRYYEAEPGTQDPNVKELIDCMARLTEDITLCHTALIEQRMAEFNTAMKQARSCPDPLIGVLLDVFQRTFGKKMTTEGLIRWCVGNDMIQQALTVYTERIPGVIMSSGILRREPWVADVPKKAYENQDAVQFLRGFLMLSDRPTPEEARTAELCTLLREYVRSNAAQIWQMIRSGVPSALRPEIAAGVENLLLVARLAYPDGDHFNAAWADGLPPEKAGLRKLEERFSITTPGTMSGFINDVRVFSADHLGILLEAEKQPDAEARLNKGRLREYVKKNAQEILNMARDNAAPILLPEIAAGVENIVLVARLAYPDGDHFDAAWADRLPPEKAGLRRLDERFSHNLPGTVPSFINTVRTFSEDQFRALMELGEKKEEAETEEADPYSQTLRQLPELLPGSGYAAECPVEQLVQVSCDYLYIKTLRNLVNHANERSTARGQQLEYLEERGYARPEELSLSDIKIAILTALNHLQKAKERKKEA